MLFPSALGGSVLERQRDCVLERLAVMQLHPQAGATRLRSQALMRLHPGMAGCGAALSSSGRCG
jgi:hypothetical protein